MQSDIAKSKGIKSDQRIRSPKSSDFGRKFDGSAHRILKSKSGIGLQSRENLNEQSLVQQQYVLRTKVGVAIDALDYEYNHDARTQSPRLSAARLQLAVGRRGLGPRDQEEQRTQRVRGPTPQRVGWTVTGPSLAGRLHGLGFC